MPFPFQFLRALFANAEISIGPIPNPFTKEWYQKWISIGMMVNPASKKACETFFDHPDALKILADKGCNPNFVMSLFTRYLWNPEVPEQEHKDPDAQAHPDDLAGVQTTRRLLTRHTWAKSPETELVNRALRQLEAIIQSYVDDLDFRTGRHLQNDKQNRVIFAIHRHLLGKSIGSQWRNLLDLLVAAGAVSFGNTALKSKDATNDSPDRRLKPRLDLFKTEHPKEAAAMANWVRDWPVDIKAMCNSTFLPATSE
jgi:hypothetical protein